ncbi:filamentous hemagglutinin N-terminal domain-containing protein [Microbulbifer sp. ALW1]|uniref:filamentous hemagglutinin N-terminal domain-containing protein n=1 Tax=Microbulbifer sp. (strain ALW1) TaxID=1516059 RepID=UPI0013579EB5|nr:filamentous hemagglutinin N-terminal domain-containing protein [Microbulbifer sp. ALW1]
MNMKRNLLSVAVSVAGMGLAVSQPVMAAPGNANSVTIDGGSVDLADITSTPAVGETTYTIDGSFAHIDWDSFVILGDETVNFDFTGVDGGFDRSAMVINRVLEGTTDIQGNLWSDGHVVLINPRGVMFGSGSSVNVAALTVAAMSGDVTSNTGDSVFSLAEGGEGTPGVVTTSGDIVAGEITLIGSSLQNSTDLSALGSFPDVNVASGRVNLLAGGEVTLTLDNGSYSGFAISNASLSEEFSGLIEIMNSGDIEAVHVLMEAGAADAMVSAAVNNTGTVLAAGIDTTGGTITLGASSAGSAAINNGGVIKVSNGTLSEPLDPVEDVRAGEISLSATDIVLGSGSALIADASTYTEFDAVSGADVETETLASGGDITISASANLSLDGTISAIGRGSDNSGGAVITSADVSLDGDVSVITASDDTTGGHWQLTTTSLAVDGVDCVTNCITSESLTQALANNGGVTISAETGSVTVNGDIQESSGNLNVVAKNGFTNSADVDVNAFSLTVGQVGADEAGSLVASDLGDVRANEKLNVQDLGGNHRFNVSSISLAVSDTESEAIASVEVDSGVVSLHGDSNAIADIQGANSIVVGDGVTLYGVDSSVVGEEDLFTLTDDALNYAAVDFYGISAVDGRAGEDHIDASALTAGINLTGFAGQLVADGVTITNTPQVTIGTLTGTSAAETFTLESDGDITVDTYAGYVFSGVSELVAGGVVGGNEIDTLDLSNLSAAELNVIASNNIEFSDSSFEASGLEALIGGSSDHKVNSTGNWIVDKGGVTNQGIHFSGGWLVTSNGADLTAEKNEDNEFIVDTSGAVGIYGILFSDLNKVLNASQGGGTITLDASSYVYGVRLQEDSDSVRVIKEDGSDGILISELTEVDTYLLAARDAESVTTTFSRSEHSTYGYVYAATGSNIEFRNLEVVQGTANGIEVIGWDDNWTFNGGTKFTNGDGDPDNNVNVNVVDMDTINTSDGVLSYNEGALFQLDSDADVIVGQTEITGLAQLTKGTDFKVSTLADLSLNAQGYAGGIALSGTAEQLNAGSLVIKGVSQITTGKLTGTTGSEIFTLSSEGTLTVDTFAGYNFYDVSDLDGASGSADTLNSAADRDWGLTQNLSSITHGSLSASNITTFDGGSGRVVGDVSGHDFVVTGDNAVQVNGSHQFTGIAKVDAGTGTDDVEAIADVTLAGSNGAFNSSLIDFTGIDSASASTLQGSVSSETFLMTGAGELTVANIEFSDLVTVKGGTGTGTEADVVTSRSGQGYILNGTGTVDHDGITFSEIETYNGAGSANLNASAYTNGLALTGNNREVSAASATFTGLVSAQAGSLNGSDQDDVFALSGSGITARNILFTGMTSVTSGGASNSVSSASGLDWALTDADTASSNGIDFNDFVTIKTSAATLTGTSGNDEFALTDSADGLTVGYEAMNFTGLSEVLGGGAADTDVGDQLDASGYGESLTLTGIDGELQADNTLTFKALNSAILANLTATDSYEEFAVTGDQALTVAALNLSGLSEVHGQSGSDKLVAVDTPSMETGYVASSGINFYDLGAISAGALDATTGDDVITYDADNLLVNGIQVEGVTTIDTRGGDNDSVTGKSGQDWELLSQTSARNNGITFNNAETLTAVSADLLGTTGIDAFALTSGGSVSLLNDADEISMTISGMSSLKGNGGNDTLDASAFTPGITLTATTGQVDAGDLAITAVTEITTDKLTGTTGSEIFTLSSGGTLTVDTFAGYNFYDVSDLDGASGSVDTLNSAADRDWGLTQNLSSITHGSLTTSNITNFSGGTGRIVGDDSDHNFLLTGSNGVEIDTTHQFNGITKVDAGTATDDVEAVAQVTLAGSDGVFNTSSIDFTGIDSASASILQGSVSNETFLMTGAGELTVANIEFSDLVTVKGGTGTGTEADVVTSRSGQGYILNGTGTVDHDGITFSEIETYNGAGSANLNASAYTNGLALTGNNREVSAASATFTGLVSAQAGSLNGSDQDDVFALSGSGITARNILFTGMTSVTSGGASNSVSSASGLDWALTDADTASSNGIDFNDFVTIKTSAATLTGTSGNDEFALTDSADGLTVGYEAMNFTGLSEVLGGGAADTDVGDQLDASGYGESLTLTGIDGELQADNTLTFKALNSAILANLTATDSYEEFAVTGDQALTVAALNLSGLSEVHGQSGSDKLVAVDTPSMETGYVASSGINFYDLGAISAGALDATTGDDVITYDADNLLVNGIQVEGVTTIDTRGGDNDSVTGKSGQDWELLSQTSARNNGITFNNAETLTAVSADLLGTTGIDAFALTSGGSVSLLNDADEISMTISGMSSLKGNGGNDTLDASAFTPGITLTATTGQVDAGDLAITAVTEITTDKLTGTTGSEIFTLSSGGTLTVDTFAGYNFYDVSDLDGASGSVDTLNSAADRDWGLTQNLSSITHGSLTTSNITNFSGGTGRIVGDDSDHNFLLTGSNGVEIDTTHQFNGITKVDAGTATDDVEAVAQVTLAGSDGVFNTSSIDFTGIDSASASILQGSVSNETFLMTGAGELTVANIEFSDLVTVKGGTGTGTEADVVTSRSGQGYILNNTGTVDHDGITFSEIETYNGSGSANLNASAYTNGLTLTGNNREVSAASATFTGLVSAQAGSLNGSDQDDVFALSGSSITARNILFTGMTSVTSGGASNSVSSASGLDWALIDADTASSNGIDFNDFITIKTSAATLTGTSGNDEFALTDSADGLTVGYEAMNFTGLSEVLGGGATDTDVGDQLDASGYGESLTLTGTDGELKAEDTLTFKAFNSAQVSELDGSAGDETFRVTGTGAISVAGLAISGLSQVNGNEGSNSISSSGSANLSEDKTFVTAEGIAFYDIGKVLVGFLEATDGDDEIAFSEDGNVTINGFEISSSTQVDGKGGTDTVTGFSGSDWTVTGDSSAENNSIAFLNVEILNALNAGLYGTGNQDDFVLNSDGSVSVGALTVNDMSFVDGLSGNDTLNASAFDAGLTLSDTAGDLLAGALTLTGIAQAKTGTLIGSSGADQFEYGSDGVITVGSQAFNGVGVLGGGAGADTFVSAASADWLLAQNAASLTHDGVSVSAVETFSGGAGRIVGDDSGHNFVVTADNALQADGVSFTGVNTVEGGIGSDDVSALAAVNLAETDGAFTSSAMAFSGIDTVSTTALLGSTAAEQFEMLASGALSVNGLTFRNLETVSGGNGEEDEVTSRTGQGYALAADDSVTHENIQFTGVELFQGQGASLAISGQEQAQVTGSGTLAAGASSFSGLQSVTLEGGNIDLAAWNGVTLNGAGAVTSGQISVTGVTTVSSSGAVTGSAGDDQFTVTGDGALSSAGIAFSDVSAVAGAGGSDSIVGHESSDWQLGSEAGALNHAAMAFSNVEQASGGSGIVNGSDADTLFTLDAAGSLVAGGIAFEDVVAVNAGVGADRVETASGERWALGAGAGSASAAGVSFLGIEQISTESAIIDGTQNSVSESFALSSETSEISVLGMLFDSVAEVFAGSEGNNEVVSDADNWQLVSGARVAANGVTFNGIDRVVTANARLTGTSAAEQFVLGGVLGSLNVEGIDFSGIGQLVGNGGADSLLGTASADTFDLASDGGITAAGIDFDGIARVDAGGGADSVSGGAGSWASVSEDGALVAGGAVATVESISVLFENLEQVENTGVYSGPSFGTDYLMTGPANLEMAGVTFAAVDTINASAGSDTLYGLNADMSWVIGGAGGSVSGGGESVAFSGFEQIVAGSGADSFSLEGGTLTSLDTGDGNDTVVMKGTLLDSLLLGSGDDVLQILGGSQPAQLSAGEGSDQLETQLADQQWQITGGVDAQNSVGEFAFTGFETLVDGAGGLNLLTNQQLDFTASGDGAGVDFSSGGMTLAYDGSGDLVLVSNSRAAIGGSLKARSADLTLAGDMDIESELESLTLRSSVGNIDVAIVEKDDLVIGQINVGRGNLSLASSGFGLLTAESFRDTHVTAGTARLGNDPQLWSNIGTVINPLRLNVTESVDIVSLFYYEPAFEGQLPAFTAVGNKGVSIASSQTSQGLKSAVQNPVDDIAQLDPGIFSEVAPYSLGIDVLNLPEVRLHGGELLPMDEQEEEERRRAVPVAAGGN